MATMRETLAIVISILITLMLPALSAWAGADGSGVPPKGGSDAIWTGALLAQILVGLVVAITTAWVTVHLALRRFRSEKWWERKAEAYSAIIEALHHMKRFADEALDDQLGGRKFPEERRKQLFGKSNEAYDELRKQIDIGSFVLSKDAVEELASFEKAHTKAKDTDSYFDFLDDKLLALNTTLQKMREIGKKDLKGR